MADPPPGTPNVNQSSSNFSIGPKITIFALMIISLSLIGMQQEAHAQTVTSTTTGDPFTIGEGNQTLSVYEFASSPITSRDPNNMLGSHIGDYQVDLASERLIINATGNLQYLLIDLDTNLGELQQTIGTSSGLSGTGVFNYNFTTLTNQNGTITISLVVFNDKAFTEQNRIGPGTGVPLVQNGDAQGSVTTHTNGFPSAPSLSDMYDTSLANKNIGYVIEFNNPVSVAGENPISVDFHLSNVNEITRTWHSQEIQPEPESPSELTQERLVALIEVRNLALDQQNLQIDYWSDPTNPFADDMVMAQDRLSNANYHISITTAQRDSYQTELDGLTG